MIHWQFEMEQQEFSIHRVLNKAIIDQLAQSFEFILVFAFLAPCISWYQIAGLSESSPYLVLMIQKRLKLLYIQFKNIALIFAKAGNSINL